MTKEIILKNLLNNHHEFIDLLFSLTENEFTLSPNNKWTAGQHFEHIYLSVSPLTKALKLHGLLLKLIFGKANRPSKDYNELIKKYHDKLEKGGTASGRFIPKRIAFEEREQLKRKLLLTVEQLCKAVDGYTESKLDQYILPHPLLGKLTIREMLYFTLYHVGHHKKLVLQSAGKVESD